MAVDRLSRYGVEVLREHTGRGDADQLSRYSLEVLRERAAPDNPDRLSRYGLEVLRRLTGGESGAGRWGFVPIS